jgi:2-iminobutanoate/2-iminopropanoate deaminase
MSVQVIHPKKPTSWMPFVPAVKIEGGSLLFISGCTALPLYHSHPHRAEEFDFPEDMERQAKRVFENIKSILHAAGADFKDIIEVKRFLTDMGENDILNNVQKEYFGEHMNFTSTTIEIKGLVRPPADVPGTKRLKIEIEAIALLKK